MATATNFTSNFSIASDGTLTTNTLASTPTTSGDFQSVLTTQIANVQALIGAIFNSGTTSATATAAATAVSTATTTAIAGVSPLTDDANYELGQALTTLQSSLSTALTSLGSAGSGNVNARATTAATIMSSMNRTYSQFMESDRKTASYPTPLATTTGTTTTRTVPSGVTTLTSKGVTTNSHIKTLANNDVSMTTGISKLIRYQLGSRFESMDDNAQIQALQSQIEVKIQALSGQTGDAAAALIAEIQSLKTQISNIIANSSGAISSQIASVQASGEAAVLNLTGNVTDGTTPSSFSSFGTNPFLRRRFGNRDNRQALAILEMNKSTIIANYQAKVAAGTATGDDATQFSTDLTNINAQIQAILADRPARGTGGRGGFFWWLNGGGRGGRGGGRASTRRPNRAELYAQLKNLNITIPPVTTTPTTAAGLKSYLNVNAVPSGNNLKITFFSSLFDQNYAGTITMPTGTLSYLGTNFMNSVATMTADQKTALATETGYTANSTLTGNDMWNIFVIRILSYIPIAYIVLTKAGYSFPDDTNMSNVNVESLISTEGLGAMAQTTIPMTSSVTYGDVAKVLRSGSLGTVLFYMAYNGSTSGAVKSSLGSMMNTGLSAVYN